ncbi:hypothetical protein V4U86_11435 [Mycobacterium sp. AMU20-3851]|uniref:hypothetical protein n=1 Tax=Mycobacterium sp. AMU20-3851 TaxID=3122055 RepID=UPI00375510A1
MARRRGSAVLAAVVVPAATFLVTDAHAGASIPAAAPAPPPCCMEVVAPPAPMAAPPALHIVNPELPAGVAPERGLQKKTILTARAVSTEFPEILTIGGVRKDSMRWHPDGLAIDVMIANYRSPNAIALGDRVVAFVLENAARFDLNHVLWRQTSYGPGRAPRPMSSRGGDTANHFDHVHIATNGGGYPRGGETYLR